MTWKQYALARKVLLEEYIGSVQREAKARENAVAKKTRSHAARMAR